MDRGFYEALLRNRVDCLTEMLTRDPSLLDGVDDAGDTPLHVAISLCYSTLSEEILHQKQELAFAVNRQGSLPLHLACHKGQLEMVNKLLPVNPDGCLARDVEGRTPFQIAAAKGRAQVLTALVQERPAGIRILTNRGETIVHLCVKHNRLETLKNLLETREVVVEVDQVINFKDDDDNTALHLSVRQKSAEMVKLLVGRETLLVHATNLEGFSAFDLLSENPSAAEKEIAKILKQAGAERSLAGNNKKTLLRRLIEPKRHEEWLTETKGALMIVAILIATVTYQAGLYPPGGVLQKDSDSTTQSALDHHPGLAVLGLIDRQNYTFFTTFNTLGFLSSLSIILMLVSGFPLEQELFMRVLMVITWVAISSMALTYGNSFAYMTPRQVWGKAGANNVACVSVMLWLAVMLQLLLLGHFIRMVVGLATWLLEKLRFLIKRDAGAHYMDVSLDSGLTSML
ncbi:ankyrin repeat-containing protein BDA1-like [Aristolochia californica]|uniref:ankyrin repeat-containing protein BDA1-like n=1 Tax=Aristolochia californica TaxID=171875 RepID=UPI0035E0CAB8